MALAAGALMAAYLIPFQAAGDRAPRELVVLGMLSVAALLNTLTNLAGRVRGAGASRPRRSWRLAVGVAVVLAAFTVIGAYAIAQALASLGPGLTSVIQQTQLVFVAAASALFLAEHISGRFMVGAGAALAGFAIMRLPALIGGADAVAVSGMLWALLSAVIIGLIHVITRRVITRIDPVAVNALRLWLAVGMLLCLPGQAQALASLDWVTWALCAGAGFVGPFTGRLCLMYSVRHISASRSALITLTTPLFAFFLGFIAFGIVPGAYEIAGGALIVAGVALPLLERTGAEPPPEFGVTAR